MNSNVYLRSSSSFPCIISNRSNFSGAAQRREVYVNLSSISVPSSKSSRYYSPLWLNIWIWLTTIEIRKKHWKHVHLVTSINNFSFSFLHLSFLHLPFSTKCRPEAARYFHTINFSRRTARRRGGKTWYRAETRTGDPRGSTGYRSRSRKVYGTFAAPRKKSMSLLAGSWRSTEPGYS